MTETYQQVVLNEGRKGSFWDAGEQPLTLEQWRNHILSTGERVYSIKPLTSDVRYEE